MKYAENKIVGIPIFSSVSATESVSLSEAKEHLYIESGNTDFDSILTTTIKQVREYLEQITCLSLVSKTVEVIIDYECGFVIPFAPVTTFTSAAVKSGVGTYDLSVLNSDYEVEAGRFISYVGNYRFKLIYVAGYTSTTIPDGLKRAMLNEIAKRFEHRGDGSERKGAEIFDTNDLIEPYKMLEWLV